MRPVRSLLILSVTIGLVVMLAVACSDQYNQSAPTAATALGGVPVASGAATLEVRGGNGNNASTAPVCHVQGNGSFRLLHVNGSARQSHLDHGDGVPGDGFDADCNPVAVSRCPCFTASRVTNG